MAIDSGDLQTAMTWIRMTCAKTRSASQVASSAATFLTPKAVIDHAVEMAEMRDPFQSLTLMYRDNVVEQIHTALDE